MAEPKRENWTSWLAAHREALRGMGLPEDYYADEGRWLDFLNTGDLVMHRRPRGFELSQLDRASLEALYHLVEPLEDPDAGNDKYCLYYDLRLLLGKAEEEFEAFVAWWTIALRELLGWSEVETQQWINSELRAEFEEARDWFLGRGPGYYVVERAILPSLGEGVSINEQRRLFRNGIDLLEPKPGKTLLDPDAHDWSSIKERIATMMDAAIRSKADPQESTE